MPRTRALFFDSTFLPLVEKLAPALKSMRTYVLMTDREHMPAGLAADRACSATRACSPRCSPAFTWPEFDENAACALCYTSGTTGEPKGALYSNRSMLLHTFFLIATQPQTCSPTTARSCPWCRCSTPTPGACPTSRR